MWVEDGDLRLCAPKGVLTRELQATLSQHKSEILQLLGQRAAPDLIEPIQGDGSMPLSFMQERLWFLVQMYPNAVAYNLPNAHRMNGRLDIHALRRALNTIVTRHEALRTTFHRVGDKGEQRVEAQSSIELDFLDISDRDHPQSEADRIARAQANAPFDLQSGPLLRCKLLRFSAEDHLLIWTIHHIITDGWSSMIFLRELKALYEENAGGPKANLPELPVQYADFAHWERRRLENNAIQEQLDYWRDHLGGHHSVLELPTDLPRPPVFSYRGNFQAFSLSKSLVRDLRQLAQGSGTTLFMALLTAFKVLLYRYSGQTEICVGSPIARRDRAEIENVIGCFINSLPLLSEVSGELSFLEFLQRVRETCAGAFRYQDVPFEKLIEIIDPVRDTSRTPLFQVMFIFHVQDSRKVTSLGDVHLTPIDYHTAGTKVDLTLELKETDAGLEGFFEYSTDLFEPETIQRMAKHFAVLLEGAVAAPEAALSQLPLLSTEERVQLLSEWNATDVQYPSDRGVHELFGVQAQATPSAVAVSCCGKSLSYAELDARSNQLSHYLRSRQIRTEMLVAICLDRSLEMLVALLGVLKAGAAYVPLDPSFPVERLEFMLQDAQVSLLLSESQLQSVLPPTDAPVVCLDLEWDLIAGQSAETLSVAIDPQQLAYVIYTSGSTGKPKGVQIPHQALTNFLLSMVREPGVTGDDVLLAVTTLSFDIAGLELYLPLIVGGQVVIASRQDASDGHRLAQCIAESRASVMQATPATWRLLFEAGWSGQPGLKVLCGGESLPRDLAQQILATDMELWNLYGPTETTIWSAVERVQSGLGPVPIGRPIANTQIHVLDHSLGLLPVGVTGELYIGGDGLARGYLNRAELTAERFIENPFKMGERLYRTGDLARYRADGRLEVLGRVDTQVKLRGYRIELGEIEAVLAAHTNVQEAVVTVREDVAGDKRIVAYVIPTSELVEFGELRSYLQRLLPDYMVPTAYVSLDSYPLTPNGKVDRNALPAPDSTRSAGGNGYVAPRTETEQALAGIWSEVLGSESVGIEDDFFDLGGHSLLAMRLVASIETRLRRQVPLVSIFQSRTIESLSRYLDQKSSARKSRTCIPLHEGGTHPPFFAGGGHPRYLDVARNLKSERPFYRLDIYALQSDRIARGLKPLTSIEEMAAHFIEQIRMVQPQGPYHLGGGCEGGYVAFEMARQLQQQGEEVSHLVVWLAPAPDAWQSPALRYAALRVLTEVWKMIRQGALRRFNRQALRILMQHEYIEYKIFKAMEKYHPASPYLGNMTLARHFAAEFPELEESTMGWKDWVTGRVEVHKLPGQHRGWLDNYWEPFSQLLDDCLGAVRVN